VSSGIRKIDVGPARVQSQPACPLCGHAGEPAFTGFRCEGPETCPNSDLMARYRRELRERVPYPYGWP
jgi:hypothetical protein